MSLVTTRFYLEAVDNIVRDIIEPSAARIDEEGSYPREAVEAFADEGILGLISAKEVDGLGEGHRAAAMVTEKVAAACGSTSMVLCMHFAGVAVIEKYGPLELRKKIANGQHTVSLAFSEQGSRSHFWAPLSTATEITDDGKVHLDAKKSWVTSAGEVDSYVWSSRPMLADGLSTLWHVPATSDGLRVSGGFNGLGLRGNCSFPMAAEDVVIEKIGILGPDGGGFDIMVNTVLPYFQIMSAACCIGFMEASTQKSIQHARTARLEHAGQSLADLPVLRANLAKMKIKTDSARALLLDTLEALEQGRPEAMLRIMEIKAVASDTAIEVTDLAMRVCGGAAFRKETGVERHFRDARAATIMAPTTDVLNDLIGRAICGMPLFG
jgi:alkylation response protein AidB-like acyl-CoA dehydrogenase